MIGGIVLHQGRIAEMRTGEGKTITACLPAYLNALTGKGVHVVTVNDYLAKYHSEWMGNIYRFLGMSVVADILLLAGLALVLAALGLLFFCAAIWFFRRCAVGFVDLVIRKGRDWCYEHGKEEL
jgi:uncharacterized membrane protein YphA (DoxX/SURF4 family)